MRPRIAVPLSYGVGSLGTGIFTTVPSVLLLYFLTTVIHIDVAIAGVIILIPKAVGLIGDPLIGTWADRLRQRSPAARKVLMSAGALLTGIGLWALFALPQLRPGNPLLPALIYFACTTGYSFFAVPYSALPAELDERPEGRRRLVSTRLGISFFGTLIGGVAAPLLAARMGYPDMGMLLGGGCIVAMGIFLLTCPLPAAAAVPVLDRSAAPTASASPIARKPFAIQMAAFAFLLASAGAFASLLPFVVRDIGGSPDVVGYAMLVCIAVAVLTSTIWPILIRRLGLRSVWHMAAAATSLSALIVGFAPGADYRFYLGMAVAGAGLSGVQIAGFTGLADLTALYLGKGRGAGLVTGIWMAGEKAGLASGPLFASLGLKFIGATMFASTARSSIALIPAVLAATAMVVIAMDSTGRLVISNKNGG